MKSLGYQFRGDSLYVSLGVGVGGYSVTGSCLNASPPPSIYSLVVNTMKNKTPTIMQINTHSVIPTVYRAYSISMVPGGLLVTTRN